jgi:hypothetical protein
MATELTPHQLNNKLKSFNKLKTINERLLFWDNELGMNYVIFLSNFNALQNYHPFEICSVLNRNNIYSILEEKTKNAESLELNKWLLENWESQSENIDVAYLFLNLKKLKKNFNEKIKNQSNKGQIVRLELKEIDDSFINFGLLDGVYFGTNSFVNLKFNANYESYTQFLKYKINPDYTLIFPGSHTINVANGITLAEYRIHIESLEKKYNRRQVEVLSESKLSNNQIALILEYTGLLDSLVCDNTVKGRLFSSLLNISYKNLYDCIREVNSKKSKNINDLKAVEAFVKENMLHVLVKTLNEDINKLSKNAD